MPKRRGGRIAFQGNPWKVATLGILGVLALGLVAGTVVAHYGGDAAGSPVATQPAAQRGNIHASHAAPSRPGAADVEACNRYASAFAGDRTKATLTNALIGGAVGAGLGAAGGAIADGGSGAGKGAGIGGLLGAAAGTVYGLNRANQDSNQAALAYRTCMRRRGFLE